MNEELKDLIIVLIFAIGITIIIFNIRNFYPAPILKDSEVVFDNDTYDKLSKIFTNNLTNETAVCLTGYYKDGSFFVQGYYQSTIFNNSRDNIEYETCSGLNIVGTIHNHFQSCDLSSKDMTEFIKNSYVNQQIYGIYCGKYVFFTANKIEKINFK